MVSFQGSSEEKAVRFKAEQLKSSRHGRQHALTAIVPGARGEVSPVLAQDVGEKLVDLELLGVQNVLQGATSLENHLPGLQ